MNGNTALVRIVAAIVGVGVLAALVVSATLAITGSGGSTEQARRGKLEQISGEPLTLRGRGFVAGEKVRVSASASGAKESRTAKANGAGSFTVAFSKIDACNGATVSAVGNKGTRTEFQLSQLVCLDG
jgi:hypothetical protein